MSEMFPNLSARFPAGNCRTWLIDKRISLSSLLTCLESCDITIEEYKRYRENIASETVSRKSYDDLTREYEQRVPKEAYDRMAVKVGELQRRMDHEFTPNENMEELRFKLKRLDEEDSGG